MDDIPPPPAHDGPGAPPPDTAKPSVFEWLEPGAAAMVTARRLLVPGFTVDLVHPQPFRMRGVQPTALIGIPFGVLRGDVVVDGERFPGTSCNDGELTFLPGGTLTESTYHTTAPFALIGVDGERLTAMTHELFDGRSGTLRPARARRPSNFGRLQPVLRAYLEGGEDWGALYLESLLTLIAAEALREAWTARPVPGARVSLPPAVLRRVLDHIEANLASDLSLSELAGVAGLSAYHFARGFRQDLGEPPHQYVLRRRVHRASRLLAHTTLPIADVAARCGFSSASHFSTIFRKMAGTTPRQYRADRT